jgi:hypothetical protein
VGGGNVSSPMFSQNRQRAISKKEECVDWSKSYRVEQLSPLFMDMRTSIPGAFVTCPEDTDERTVPMYVPYSPKASSLAILTLPKAPTHIPLLRAQPEIRNGKLDQCLNKWIPTSCLIRTHAA